MNELYSIEVGFAGPAPSDPTEINDRLEGFLEVVGDTSAVVTGTPEEPVDSIGRFGVRLAVETYSVTDAVASIVPKCQSAAKKAGLPDYPVVSVEVLEWAEFERQLEIPTFPNVVGVTELADMLGVSKQRASELARVEHFPKPFVELASGPIWVEPNIRDFVATWERKPGRPRNLVR